VPVAQFVHAAALDAPVCALYVPAAHAGHTSQAVCFASGCTVPAARSTHPDAADAAEARVLLGLAEGDTVGASVATLGLCVGLAEREPDRESDGEPDRRQRVADAAGRSKAASEQGARARARRAVLRGRPFRAVAARRALVAWRGKDIEKADGNGWASYDGPACEEMGGTLQTNTCGWAATMSTMMVSADSDGCSKVQGAYRGACCGKDVVEMCTPVQILQSPPSE